MKILRIIHQVPATAEPCRYCIDGFAPTGISPIVGPFYMRCVYCEDSGAITTCPACDGEAFFPASFTCLACFLGQCAEQGCWAVMCPGCLGVVDLVPLDPGNTP